MLKKLRRKMILINMLTVGVVLLMVFAFLLLGLCQAAAREMRAGLYAAMYVPENRQALPFIGRPQGMDVPRERMDPLTDCVVAVLDEEGNVEEVWENRASMSMEDLEKAILSAGEQEAEEGKLRDMQLLYVRQTDFKGRVRMAFADSSPLAEIFWRSVVIFLGLYLLFLGALLAISIWLSGVAVRPAQKAWEKQKQFVADASHELKTPLTVIMANNNILMSRPQSSIAQENQWLQSTAEETERMKRMIDDMLLLARSEAQETAICLQKINLSDLLQAQILYFESIAFERAVSIESEIEQDASVLGDRELLQQLVQILIDNAVKYAPEHSAVRVGLRRESGSLKLFVNNRGETIPEEDIPHLFDRFYRTSHAKKQGGYGLGLAIAQNIAHLHGARIGAQSSKEQGNTFEVCFLQNVK